MTRSRLRDLGISIGAYPTGPFNAITDVAGVRVGHATNVAGLARTGVTVILPNDGDAYLDRISGGAFILNGAGEMSGLIQVQEWGLIETPILLTNTLSVGAVANATVEYLVERHPEIGVQEDVIIPLVGECDDSFLNNIAGGHVNTEHVFSALASATSGPVAEGNVGGGTGMVAFDLKGGIGTSSRVLHELPGPVTLGVLVMSNVGRLEDFRVDGVPVGAELTTEFAEIIRRRSLYGSIIAVLGTDAPLSTHQLQRICKRVALGIGRVGSYAAHGSGEIIMGFSTANRHPRSHPPIILSRQIIADRYLDPLYRAAIECTEEAMVNAMCMAEPMTGANGQTVPALPLDTLAEIYFRQRGGGPRRPS